MGRRDRRNGPAPRSRRRSTVPPTRRSRGRRTTATSRSCAGPGPSGDLSRARVGRGVAAARPRQCTGARGWSRAAPMLAYVTALDDVVVVGRTGKKLLHAERRERAVVADRPARRPARQPTWQVYAARGGASRRSPATSVAWSPQRSPRVGDAGRRPPGPAGRHRRVRSSRRAPGPQARPPSSGAGEDARARPRRGRLPRLRRRAQGDVRARERLPHVPSALRRRRRLRAVHVLYARAFDALGVDAHSGHRRRAAGGKDAEPFALPAGAPRRDRRRLCRGLRPATRSLLRRARRQRSRTH